MRESVSCKWNAWDSRKMRKSWDLWVWVCECVRGGGCCVCICSKLVCVCYNRWCMTLRWTLLSSTQKYRKTISVVLEPENASTFGVIQLIFMGTFVAARWYIWWNVSCSQSKKSGGIRLDHDHLIQDANVSTQEWPQAWDKAGIILPSTII